ncbi:MAG: hypothetical protein COB14_03260 [Alphaproteobacteria bacterium]|nr:MAG: hypothetical protein COB14_03260 [Alphaproteobacteria bacterium]
MQYKIIENLDQKLANQGFSTPCFVNGQPFYDRTHFVPIGETRLLSIRNDLLKNDSVCNQGIHMGAAGIMNLEMAAATKAQGVILFDVNHNQSLMWKHVIDIIKRNSDRKLAVQEIKGNLLKNLEEGLAKNPELGAVRAVKDLKDSEIFGKSPVMRGVDEHAFYDAPGFVPFIKKLSNDNESFLGDNKLYTHIHNLACSGGIAPITLDLTDRENFQKLRALLVQEELKVNTFYSSNIQSWYSPTFLQSFFEHGPGKNAQGTDDRDYLSQIFNRDQMQEKLVAIKDNIRMVVCEHGYHITALKTISGVWPHIPEIASVHSNVTFGILDPVEYS